MYWPGGLLLIAAPVVWGYQVLRWLIDGYWTSYSLLKLPLQQQLPFEVPTLQWKGVQLVVTWVLELPLGLLCLVVGTLLLWGAIIIDDANERREDREREEARIRLENDE